VVSAVVWTVIEVISRRIVGRKLGQRLDDGLAADMLAILSALPVTSALVARLGTENGINAERREYRWTPGAVIGGLVGGIVCVLLPAVTMRIDSVLFGEQPDHGVVDEETSVAGRRLFAAVNGVAIPVAEEFTWRGVVQSALTDRFGGTTGIGLTGTLFVLKHAVVDRSLNRLTTLLAIGTVFGVLRHRLGTGASTIAHVTANLLASLIALAVQRSE
jgi:membrane protease YdiL (CAAX protease family)